MRMRGTDLRPRLAVPVLDQQLRPVAAAAGIPDGPHIRRRGAGHIKQEWYQPRGRCVAVGPLLAVPVRGEGCVTTVGMTYGPDVFPHCSHALDRADPGSDHPLVAIPVRDVMPDDVLVTHHPD